MKPKVLILRTAGTNCEVETAYAFELVGAQTETKHINSLRDCKNALKDYQFIAIPGGFSYGDDIASGRVFANELMSVMREAFLEFIERGGYIIGICNGFQVLVKSGLLPRCNGDTLQSATLTDNISGLYTDRWVSVKGDSSVCAWIPDEEEIELPVAHAEGRFTAAPDVLKQLKNNNQIALRYSSDTNFNGSDDAIAGVCDPSGRVFGLMPHPERFLRWENHPQWTRLPHQREGAGVRMFRTAMRHAKES
ncbi:MAG: phosphoribosylformylglycinamidine synthase I [Planctomycetes bacterium]|nr:phosphoribosylformylglycinamidine synthase I [Planctomycetota bacterium]